MKEMFLYWGLVLIFLGVCTMASPKGCSFTIDGREHSVRIGHGGSP